MGWLHVLFALLINAVPLYGIKVLGWSIGTVLVLYWLENLLVAVFTCARIWAHRLLTRAPGHYRSGQLATIEDHGRVVKSTLLSEYAGIAFPFTLVHGVFVLGIVFIIGGDRSGAVEWQFSYDQFRYGALQMLVVLGAAFLVDLLSMRRRTFEWIRDYAAQRLGRVLILHLGIIFGMWAMAKTDSPIGVLYAIIGLKTLWDIAAGSRLLRPRKTAAPWMQRLFDRIADADKVANPELEAEVQRAITARGGAGKVDAGELMHEMLRARGVDAGAPRDPEDGSAR